MDWNIWYVGSEGFRLLGDAANGQEALALIHELNPDIVITDLKMPQMDGLQLTTIIQQQYPVHFWSWAATMISNTSVSLLEMVP